MQEEKQEMYKPQKMNKNSPENITSILGDIKSSLFVIMVIVLLMFLLQMSMISMVMNGLPVRPVWY